VAGRRRLPWLAARKPAHGRAMPIFLLSRKNFTLDKQLNGLVFQSNQKSLASLKCCFNSDKVLNF
jgi:hypothetical protein